MSSSSAVYDFIVGNATDYQSAFTPAKAVESFHTLPRFSHSGDFSLLFSDDPDEVRDYTLGLLFIACFVMAFFTVWGFLIMLFKCIGPKYMGVFSGHPYREAGAFAATGRIIFGLSSLMVMIFSILAVTKGLKNLDLTTDEIEATNTDVLKIHDEFVGISTNLKQVAREATPVRDELVDFLKNDVCPLKPLSSTETQVRILGNVTLSAMEKLDDFIEEQLKDLDEALELVEKASNDVDEAVKKTDFTGAAAAGIMVPFFIIPALLSVTLYFAWFEVYSEAYYCFTTYLLMPVFIVMVIFAYVAAGFVVLSAEGNADWCSGGAKSAPEGTIGQIMKQHELSKGMFYFDVISFYTNQCRTDSPWEFLEGYHFDLTTAQDRVDTFTNAIIATTPDQLSQECGVDYNPTLQLLVQLQTYTRILSDSSQRSMDLMSCQNIVPLYTATVHESTCSTSITAATWLFSCFFIISFFGMLMVMFRGACYPIYYFEGKELDYSTSEDEAGLQEEETNDDYVDESMMDTTAYDQDTLGQALEESEGEYYGEESVEYEESTYGESQYSGRN
mmetsp:Transcript_1347/g.1877  ORF Transcript_1347/g.1877 Transcript_1347/m.1877 type:complete len:559 (-) Transcript_1347:99-1775(-)